MEDIQFKTIINKQHQFFYSGKTLPISFRLQQLKKLKTLLQTYEPQIVKALKKDLNKADTEAVLHEILLVYSEIDHMIKQLPKWARPKKVHTPFPALWPGRSSIYLEPYGCVLIIAPWNYPFMLVMSPLVGAIGAGNCAIIKPSELATHTEVIITKIINEHFPSEYLHAIKAGPEEVSQLLQEKFDFIFFTGGTKIGKIIMEAAAKNLTPVTLELGGKSPCIVDQTADLDFTARRIIWGKFINAGQTCIAPDFLYVPAACKEVLVNKLKKVIHNFYGDDPQKSPSYGRIINKKHFERLIHLMHQGNIVIGGQTHADSLYISPTLIDGITWQDSIMQEEIFGPLLPILTYEKLEEVVDTLKQHPKPLALYLFTKSKETETQILTHVSFGGGCINDCLLHIANLNLPFGGVGSSGFGNYHGQYSFETFSHRKSVYKKTLLIDIKVEYPPYTNRKLWWLRRLFKL